MFSLLLKDLISDFFFQIFSNILKSLLIILLFNPKLQRPWKGPMLVVERLNDVLFRIQSGQKTKPVFVHHDKLKPYLGEDKPDWLVNKKT